MRCNIYNYQYLRFEIGIYMGLAKIVLLEGDLELALIVQEWLSQAGYEVDVFNRGLDFLRNFPLTQYDLCIFNWILPDLNGPDVMNSIRLRYNKVPPIVFFTAHSEESDIVRVIESGADDYIVKPASRQMLLARVNALLRRSATPQKSEMFIELGSLKIDVNRRMLLLHSEGVKLTDKEFDLAVYFIRNEGVLLPRAHLINVVWGSSSKTKTRTLDVHVSHVRNKLKLMPEFGWKLTSISARISARKGYQIR